MGRRRVGVPRGRDAAWLGAGMPGMRRPVRTLVAAALLALGSCDSVTGPELELARQRLTWERSEPVAYVFEMQRYCFCTPESTAAVVVEVQDGSVFRRVYRDSGEEVGGGPQELFPSLSGVFDLLEEMMRRKPHRLDIEYDPERGFPVSIEYDGDAGIADDELSISIRAFRRGDPG